MTTTRPEQINEPVPAGPDSPAVETDSTMRVANRLGSMVHASDKVLWLMLNITFFVFWTTSLCPGLFLSDSFNLFGRLEAGAYDGTFSYLYQLVLKPIYAVGLPIRAVAVIAFVVQMATYYGILSWIGWYLLGFLPRVLAWVPLSLTLVNPVFPIMYGLHTVNTAANLLFVLFLFLIYRALLGEMWRMRVLVANVLLGAILVALRFDTLPSVVVAYGVLLVQRRAVCRWQRPILAAAMIGSTLTFNVALPSIIGFHPPSSTYILTLIYRPLDKLLASDEKLLSDPSVTEPIEKIIRMPASKIVGHGDEVYWWDINRQPSPEDMHRQLSVLFRLGIERLHVLVGDRASMLIEVLGSSRSFFFGDSLVLAANTPFEAGIVKWNLRQMQFPHSEWVKRHLSDLQSTWSPTEPRYWLWNQLPYFLLLCLAAVLYAFAPATSLVAFLVIIRVAVVACLAPYGFYFYCTSVYLVGLLIVPLGLLEQRKWSAEHFSKSTA